MEALFPTHSSILRRMLPRAGWSQLLLVTLFAFSAAGAMAQEYRLGPQDKIRLRVVEWKASKAEYFDWNIFAGEYSVSPSGTVALPLIGSLQAEGRTADEFALSVAEILQKRAGIVNRPEATVEIVQFRPIYVLGSVQNPGEYPFRPGLTVLQAAGLAGGFYRETEAGLIRLERDRITAVGAYESARLEMRRLLVRRARLAAELAESKDIEPPSELSDDRDAAKLIGDELAIMKARDDELRSQLAASAEIKSLFLKEIEALEQKIAVQDRQVALARRERQTVSNLVEKGLAVSSREFVLEREVANLESKVLDYTTAMLRARQEVSKADRDASDLKSERKAKIVSEMQQTEANLDQIKARLTTARGLMYEAANTAPQLLLKRMEAKQSHALWIIRGHGKDATEIKANENTIVNPGDVVRIELAGEGKLSGGAAGLSAALPDTIE